jgi:hypothetical protein
VGREKNNVVCSLLTYKIYDIYQEFYIIVLVRALYFVGSSLEDIRAFPAAARREAGYQLYRVKMVTIRVTGSQ